MPVQGLSGSVASLASIVGLLAGGVLFNVMERQIFPLVAGLVFVVTLLSLRHARSGVTPGTGEGEGDSRAQSPATVSP